MQKVLKILGFHPHILSVVAEDGKRGKVGDAQYADRLVGPHEPSPRTYDNRELCPDPLEEARAHSDTPPPYFPWKVSPRRDQIGKRV